MQQPLVSIVLPTYNGERYIRKSIESCLNQSFKDFELIIVNDCSTDTTPAIINEYMEKDQRVKVINNPFNRKLPLSLNLGFELAKGRYFTWTSDDNYYSHNALEVMVNALEKDQTKDLVYADYTLIDGNDVITGERTFNDINNSFNKWLGCGACFLYKREVHAQNKGYRPEAFLIEDYDFFVRAYLDFNFSYLNTPALYYYREHSSSLTATQNTFINDVSKMFLEKNLPGLEKKLPGNELQLLYRKFAIYFSVQKNNREKYQHYLLLLSRLSKQQVFITACYVFITKCINTMLVGLTGIGYSIKLLFSKAGNSW
jgi:glycosyltransferase involved in cell wall biosynthesis